MALSKFSVMAFLITQTMLPATYAKAVDVCIMHHDLAKNVVELSQTQNDQNPEFRIKKAEDGQSLIYWHFGGETGSFFAATFKADGCAILTSSGELRKFTFPKTAFNTGVFFEMDVFETGL